MAKKERKQTKTSPFTDKEVADLTEAVQIAFGNSTADEIMDEAFAFARKLQEYKKRQQQPRIPPGSEDE